jgi:hypothetical protein
MRTEIKTLEEATQLTEGLPLAATDTIIWSRIGVGGENKQTVCIFEDVAKKGYIITYSIADCDDVEVFVFGGHLLGVHETLLTLCTEHGISIEAESGEPDMKIVAAMILYIKELFK